MRSGIALTSAVTVLLLSLPAAAGAGPGAIAPLRACPGQGDAAAPAGEQLRAMLCMTNYARHAAGLAPLRPSRQLRRAAAAKSADILRCDEFSHAPCGRPWTHWIRRFGYLRGCWRVAENIAWGAGSARTVRSIFKAWMRSTGHRENILGDSTEIGIGRNTGTLGGNRGVVVWTQDFGSHEC